MATIEKEPAVFHAFRMVMPICDLKGITQEDKAVRQNVIPVRDKNDQIIAVLIREKDISKELQKEKQYQVLAERHQEEETSTRFLSEAQKVSPADGSPIRDLSPGHDDSILAMREIHHRIKNNLQLVSSILNLQALSCNDPKATGILQDSISRIRSISAIHELLIGRRDGQMTISLGELLDRLIFEIQTLYEVNDRIMITRNGDDLNLSSHTATSVAIVVTELLTNSIKHAFKENESGLVTVSVVKGTQFNTVTVKDSGKGFDPAAIRPDSLGLELVRSTVKERLGGIMHFFSDENGTRVSFDFSA